MFSLRESSHRICRATLAPTVGTRQGLPGVVYEMIKVTADGGSECNDCMACNDIIAEARIPVDWKKAFVSLFEGNGGSLECGSFSAIKLLELLLKIAERVREMLIRTRVQVDEKQFGFMTGKGTTDIIFIVRQMMERNT